jgi:hypothetical protein
MGSALSRAWNVFACRLAGAILAIALACAPVRAEDSPPLRLWNAKGDLVDAYDFTVGRIPSGTRLELKPGIVVTIGRWLGTGEMTYVYEIGDGKVIRLPKGSGLSKMGPAYSGFSVWFEEGVAKVEKTAAPVVKVFHEESWPDHYVIAEKLEPGAGLERLFSLEDLIAGKIEDPKVAERLEAELLVDFAPRTWLLRHVSDMRTDQILYTSRGWIIADLSNTVRHAKVVEDATLFSSMGKLPPAWRLKLERAVTDHRRRLAVRGSKLDEVLARVRRCTLWFQGAMNF